MQKLVLTMALLLGANAFGQVTPRAAEYPADLVPPGYIVVQEIEGDLNKDDQADSVLIIKETNKENFIEDEHRGSLDRNRRGIIIALKNQGHYELALENQDCFSSENEDGGVYIAPELGVFIEKGNLRVHYFHGRYGFWVYKFRYQNSDFELIGYDSEQNRGPFTERSTSINLMTKKMQIKEYIDQDTEAGGEGKFTETWKKFTLLEPIKLRDISSFDDFDITNMLGSVQ